MGILEWMGAHLLAPFINLYRAFHARPRPDVRIVELAPTGGGTYVDFDALIQNYGTQPVRVTVTARVGDQDVQVNPSTVDLLVNAQPNRVSIRIPRPELGELVQEVDDEPTLYDRTLRLEVTSPKGTKSAEWHEKVYAPEEGERHALQQRRWRFGRGEETPDDLRAEYLAERFRRLENPEEGGPDYDFV